MGIGPGGAEEMTAAAVNAISRADAVAGYKYYLPFVEPLLKPGAEIIGSGMRQERERAEAAFEAAATPPAVWRCASSRRATRASMAWLP